jgi:hypothetical protein
MPFDPEAMLLEIDRKVSVQGEKLDRLVHKLEGNGQPGLFTEFTQVKQAHEECQRQKKEAKEQALREADASLRKAVAAASIIATLLTTLLSKLL